METFYLPQPYSTRLDELQENGVTTEDLLAALPVPLVIEEGRTFVVPSNIQMPFRQPIQVDGVLQVDGMLYEVPELDFSDLLVAGTGISVAWNGTTEQWTITSTAAGTTNLSIANRGATTLDVASDTGTDATIPAATTSLAGLMASADKTKLSGIEAGATANSSDSTLLARANHTGTQAISTVFGLQTALDAKASSTHTHGNITNDGRIGTTASLPLITTTGGTVTVGSFGTTAGTFAAGDDTRIVNAAQRNANNDFTGWLRVVAANDESLIRARNPGTGASQTRIDLNNDVAEGSTAGASIFLCSSTFGSGYSSACGVWNHQAGPIVFGTQNIPRMWIEASGGVRVVGAFSCNGKSVQAAQTVNAAATDPATTQALVNQIRQALINTGILQ